MFPERINPSFLPVLRLIVERLAHTDVVWVLTGSLAFALQGVPVEPHDIDLQSDKAGAYTIERQLAEFVVTPVAFSTSEKIRSHMGSLNIHGIRVELMGDIQKRRFQGAWEAPLDLLANRRTIHVDGLQIPVLPLEYEYQAYVKMGRLEKAKVLRRALNAMKA